jgi:hypothetical protein
MSRSTNEAMALVSLVAGCASEINKRRLISRVDMRALADDIYASSINTIDSWDETGDAQKNTAQIMTWINTWDCHFFKNTPKNEMRVAELVAMAERILSELLSKVRCRRHRLLVTALHDKVIRLMGFTDMEWTDFRAFELAGASVDDLTSVMVDQEHTYRPRAATIDLGKTINNSIRSAWRCRSIEGVMA